MLVVVWLVCVAICILFGYGKGRPVLGIVIALLVPFAGVVAMAMVPAKDTRGLTWKKPKGHQRECPWCHEMMPFDGKMCGKCFQRVPPPDQWLGTAPPPPVDAPVELPPSFAPSPAPPPAQFPPPPFPPENGR
jgi:hypothetical protein